ncbi:MAG: IPT/TIG domain-containing protein, partial [Polyangiaceae bacterium]
MSRTSVFLVSLGVGTWLAAAGLGGCSSSNTLPEMDPTSQDSGASPGNGGGLSSVTDGTDAAAAVDAGPTNGGSGDVAPAPLLSSIAPTFAAVGALGPTLIVKGSSFTEQSVIRVDGTELATTFFSNSEIHAAIPNDKLVVATTLHISVKTPAPGGGASADLPFEVRNVAPALTTLAPASALAGSADAPLTLSGNSFAPSPSVYFDGSSLTVTSASASSISTLIPSALLKASGSHNVTVVNAAPGGGTSNAIAFTVSNPTVTITSVTPASATVN